MRNGVVQDKLFLPGLRKLRRLVESGFFGRILSVRGEFGYWVFEGDWQEANRPVLELPRRGGRRDRARHVLPLALRARPGDRAGALGQRDDRHAHPRARGRAAASATRATADDAAYGVFELEGGIVAQLNSSWAVRVFRDELVEFQVDGTHGSAVAGLRRCRIQPREATPRAVWNPDLEAPEDFRSQWLEVPDNEEFDNGFKVQWEAFLRHVAEDAPFPWDLARGRQGRAARPARPALGRRGAAARGAGAERMSGHRVAFAAAHVVADPLAPNGPGAPRLDWEATLAFRRHLWSHGLGVADAMDTAQRGMGLDWPVDAAS